MVRRELFRILGAGLVAAGPSSSQHTHRGTSAAPENYEPRFFSKFEYEILERVCDIIIPSDRQSPGASAVGVPFYIDTVLLYAGPERKERWKAGVAEVETTAGLISGGKSFAECTAEETERVVEMMAQNEKNPTSDLERFFGPLKLMMIDAYCLSEPGMKQYLGYRGEQALSRFAGCQHDSHG